VKDGIRRVTPQKSDSPKFYIVQHQGTSARDTKEFLLPKLKPMIKAKTKSQPLTPSGAAVAQSELRLGHGLQDPGSHTRQGKVFLSSPKISERTLRQNHPPYLAGAAGNFPGVKRPKHEVEHSSPFSVKAKNMWSYASISPYACMECTGTFHFSLTLLRPRGTHFTLQQNCRKNSQY
jgi:hypothetical protein